MTTYAQAFETEEGYKGYAITSVSLDAPEDDVDFTASIEVTEKFDTQPSEHEMEVLRESSRLAVKRLLQDHYK
jgi:hypothetical protein